MQLRKESLKKIRLAGIRTLTSAIPVQRSNQLMMMMTLMTMIFLNTSISKAEALSRLLTLVKKEKRRLAILGNETQRFSVCTKTGRNEKQCFRSCLLLKGKTKLKTAVSYPPYFTRKSLLVLKN